MTRARAGGVRQTMVPTPSDCHPDKPLYAKGKCRSCYEKGLRTENPDFAERQRVNCRKWVQDHAAQKKQKDKEWRAKKDKDWRRAITLKHRFGITPEDYQRLLDAQGGVCAICGTLPKRVRLGIDHCHKTGKIRGLLCFRCNFGLSYFSEDALRLKRASDYLEG